ncbi:MAG: TlpA family protein disulfide reductase [Planctomycetes bacterium]|nr:TlpA family protein disulfide reductase [Planctomycetota bacterium]
MSKTIMIAVLACALAPALFAGGSLTGQDCPSFSATRFINPPADGKTSFEDCKGEVILVKLWGTHCGPCLKSMPEVQALWNKYEGKGLHVFMSERQNSSEADIQKVYSSKGLTFPQVLEGNMGGFPGVGTIPYAYVIGVDGKVVFEGHSGYGAAIETEIEKIKYLGLGKNDVAPGLEKAATAFSAKDYAGAREEATKAKEKSADNEAVVADADYIIGRVDAVIEKLLKRVEDTKAARRYHETVAALEELSGKEFKGMEVADKAKEDLKELKKDKDVKNELKAWDALAKTLEANDKAKSDDAKKANLEGFIRKYEGTAAAGDAQQMLGAIGSDEGREG